ncbi:hypothetical protein [Actinophytocola sp.]|uniref:hypothetical protein n=1 Tax=Actinophytocola sp. TaxID=1872138 RepID=UPI002D7E413F|nr:hypothetical protein [Actinophytocola sp.]HET9141684.1 hypothetical protein [Actinophytocola sp.]
MLKLVAENNVRDLLASLGFPPDDPNAITIERFDHWTNEDCTDWFAATCASGAILVETERSAA